MQAHTESTSIAPIVVADRGEALDVLRAGLPFLPLVVACSVDEARRLVTPGTPLVLCDCHFDDGRMYDLLRWLKASSGLAHVPFLAIRVREGELDDAIYESVTIAVSALGGDGFIDLYRWQQRYGAEEAARRFSQHIEALALGNVGGLDTT
jgi:CheY-like chemotaxis protein